MFLYGIEGWMFWQESSLRFFAEYADLTSYWWNGATRTRNLTYGHHIYRDGYRFRGRPVGHWADQDAKILSFGSLFMKKDGVGWGLTLRIGDLVRMAQEEILSIEYQLIIHHSIFTIRKISPYLE